MLGMVFQARVRHLPHPRVRSQGARVAAHYGRSLHPQRQCFAESLRGAQAPRRGAPPTSRNPFVVICCNPRSAGFWFL